jgi:hypothetical protein
MTAVPMTLFQTFVKLAQVEFEMAHLIQTCALARLRLMLPVIIGVFGKPEFLGGVAGYLRLQNPHYSDLVIRS